MKNLTEGQILTANQLVDSSKFHSIYVLTSHAGTFVKADKKDLREPEIQNPKSTFEVMMINYGGLGRTIHVKKLSGLN